MVTWLEMRLRQTDGNQTDREINIIVKKINVIIILGANTTDDGLKNVVRLLLLK